MGRAHGPFCLANLFAEVPLVHSCQAAPPSLTLRLEHPRTPSPLKSIISLALSRLLQPLIRPLLLFICFTTGFAFGSRPRDSRACLFGPCSFVVDIFARRPFWSLLRSPRLCARSRCLQPVQDCLSAPISPTPTPTNNRDTHRSRFIDDAFPNSSDTGLSARGAVRHEGIGQARPHTADIRAGLR